jgi:hypothetical protein
MIDNVKNGSACILNIIQNEKKKKFREWTYVPETEIANLFLLPPTFLALDLKKKAVLELKPILSSQVDRQTSGESASLPQYLNSNNTAPSIDTIAGWAKRNITAGLFGLSIPIKDQYFSKQTHLLSPF